MGDVRHLRFKSLVLAYIFTRAICMSLRSNAEGRYRELVRLVCFLFSHISHISHMGTQTHPYGTLYCGNCFQGFPHPRQGTLANGPQPEKQ